MICWGDNKFGQCNVPSDIHSVVGIGCSSHSAALTAEGRLVAWGKNNSGQCNVPEQLQIFSVVILL
jgi:alpha-tubulin suppressor-like RCC1 family protein